MQNFSSAAVIEKVAPLGIEASRYLRQAYKKHRLQSFKIARKADQSLITEADTKVHHLLFEGLKSLYPNIPIMSEEGKLTHYHLRDEFPWYWLIDPLDGTREFVEKTGQFCINIALMFNGFPILGLIFYPQERLVYVAGQGFTPMYSDESLGWQPIPCDDSDTVVIVASSRNVGHRRLLNIKDKLVATGRTVDIKTVGSALKYCELLKHRYAIYPRYGATSHWDTAAGQALVEHADGGVYTGNGIRLDYPADKLINPSFIAMSAGCKPHSDYWVALFAAEGE